MKLEEVKSKMESAVTHLKEELRQIRTGRAHPALVEDLEVEAYGAPSDIKSVASVSIPEARQILIAPWDKSLIKDIEKAIFQSPLGLNPTIEGEHVRLTLPELTEERRDELAKLVHAKAEDGRVALRNIREDYLRSVKQLVEQGTGSEDDNAKAKKDVQELIDQHNQAIANVAEEKITELKTV
jgi:ribosome recycling factor